VRERRAGCVEQGDFVIAAKVPASAQVPEPRTLGMLLGGLGLVGVMARRRYRKRG